MIFDRLGPAPLKTLMAEAQKHWVLLLSGAAALGLVFGAGALATVALYETGLARKIVNRLTPGPAAAPSGDTRPADTRAFETALTGVELMEVGLGSVNGQAQGGGLAVYGDRVMVTSARGRIGYVDLSGGAVAYLEPMVPMNQAGFEDSAAQGKARFNPNWFRTMDLMVVRGEAGDQLYASYHRFEADERICVAVSRIGLDMADGVPRLVGEWTEIYRVDPCYDLEELDFLWPGHMSGGRMLQSSDERFYLTVGSFGLHGPPFYEVDVMLADSGNDLSKLLEIDMTTGAAEVIATGFRNAQGLAVDEFGRIWSTEHGPQGGDELNLVVPGADYGWPFASYGTGYADFNAPRTALPVNPEQGRHAAGTRPALAFVPSVAVSQLAYVPEETERFAAWAGDLLISSLREGTIYRVRLEGDRVVYTEPIKLDRRIRDLERLPDGRFVMLTERPSLLILDEPRPEAEVAVFAGYDAIAAFEPAPAETAAEWSRELFRRHCSSCHAIDGSPAVGPSLTGVIGRRVASVEGYPYSPALSSAGGKWSRERLYRFLADPENAGFGGSAMPRIAVDGDEYAYRAVIEYANAPD